MAERAAAAKDAPQANGSKGLTIATWAGQVIVAGIFAMGAVPKFTGQAGALAAKLPMGDTAVYLIGAVEVAAIALILIPKTAVYGAALAAIVMLGAILSHFTVVGFEGDFGAMFGMALVAFLAAAAVVGLRRSELPLRR